MHLLFLICSLISTSQGTGVASETEIFLEGVSKSVFRPSLQHVPADPRASLRPPGPTVPAHPVLRVSLVGYASDASCGEDVFNAMARATYPERIVVAIKGHRALTSAGCVADYCARVAADPVLKTRLDSADADDDDECPFKAHIQVDVLVDTGDRPLWAMRGAQDPALTEGADFCLQSISYLQFVSSWDTALLADWLAIDNERGILTTVTQDASWLKKTELGYTSRKADLPLMCGRVLAGGRLRPRGAGSVVATGIPLLQTQYTSMFSFSKCHVDQAVPFSKEQDDFGRLARLWTSGYDMYTPARNLVAHDYAKLKLDDIGTGASDPREGPRIGGDLDKLRALDYGLAAEATALDSIEPMRSWESFLRFNDLWDDLEHLDTCHQLRWVPFDEELKASVAYTDDEKEEGTATESSRGLLEKMWGVLQLHPSFGLPYIVVLCLLIAWKIPLPAASSDKQL